jgi:hypothetical protein
MMSGDESYGMMTDEELAELENSMGSGFEKMWLTMMLAQQKELELINLLLANLGN